MSIVKNIDPKTLNGWIEQNNAVIIDVRENLEFHEERIESAKNIPCSEISLETISPPAYKNKKIVMQCRSGKRSALACYDLQDFDPSLELYNLDGGILAWKEQGYKTIKS